MTTQSKIDKAMDGILRKTFVNLGFKDTYCLGYTVALEDIREYTSTKDTWTKEDVALLIDEIIKSNEEIQGYSKQIHEDEIRLD